MKRFQPSFDPLEGRQLLSAGVSARVVRGVLNLRGGDGPDAVSVQVMVLAPRGRGLPTGTAVISAPGARPLRLGRIGAIAIDAGPGTAQIMVHQAGRRVLPVQVVRGTIIGSPGGPDLIVQGAGSVRDAGPGQPQPAGSPTTILPPAPAPVAIAVNPQPSSPAPATPSGAATWSTPTVVRDVIAQVNQARRDQGLAPLQVSDRLTRAAQIHADDMARLDTMQHTLDGVAQPTLVDRANAVGYSYAMLGENIAYNFLDATSVMTAWLGSSGHRANILNAGFTEIGVAIALNASGQPYYCQVFGKPA